MWWRRQSFFDHKITKLFFGSVVTGVSALLFPVFAMNNAAAQSSQPIQLTVPQTSLLASGKAAPDAHVTIFRNNVEIGSTTANKNGKFSKTIQPIPTGTSNISILYTDKANRSSSRKTINLAFQPQQQTALEVFLSPTVRVAPQRAIVSNQSFVFSGSTVPGAIVTVQVVGGRQLQATANNIGEYTIRAAATDFGVGVFKFDVSSSKNNQTSELSDQGSFAITQFIAPPVAVPDIDQAAQATVNFVAPPQITAPADGATITTSTVELTGIATPNSQLLLYQDGLVVSSIFTDADGSWRLLFSPTRDSHELYVVACIAEVCSEPSNIIILTFSTIRGVCSIDASFEAYRFWGVAVDDDVALRLREATGSPPLTVHINWGDGESEQFTLETSQMTNQVFRYRYSSPGIYNGVATIVDGFGCNVTRYFSVQVVEDVPLRLSSWNILPIVIGVSVLFGSYSLTRLLIKS